MNPHGAALQPLLRRFVVAAGAAKRAVIACAISAAVGGKRARGVSPSCLCLCNPTIFEG